MSALHFEGGLSKERADERLTVLKVAEDDTRAGFQIVAFNVAGIKCKSRA